MNSIPLIKGNTPQEINTSIIALKKALYELEAQDRLLQGTDKDVQDKIKQINELIAGINTHLSTVDTHLSAIDGQITALQPVDTVTSGNMHSVTSNAVFNALDVLKGLQSLSFVIVPNNLPKIFEFDVSADFSYTYSLFGYSDDFGFFSFSRGVADYPAIFNNIVTILFERPIPEKIRLTATNSGNYSTTVLAFLAPTF